jgi:hypothetical protein
MYVEIKMSRRFSVEKRYNKNRHGERVEPDKTLRPGGASAAPTRKYGGGVL